MKKLTYILILFALISLIVVVTLSAVIHVFINHDFADKFGHSLVIWIITGTIPYLCGTIFKLIKKYLRTTVQQKVQPAIMLTGTFVKVDKMKI